MFELFSAMQRNLLDLVPYPEELEILWPDDVTDLTTAVTTTAKAAGESSVLTTVVVVAAVGILAAVAVFLIFRASKKNKDAQK